MPRKIEQHESGETDERNREMDPKEKAKQLEILQEKVFVLANELAIAGYGDAAVGMHIIHNEMKNQ